MAPATPLDSRLPALALNATKQADVPLASGMFALPDLVSVLKQISAEAAFTTSALTTIAASDAKATITNAELVARASKMATGLCVGAGVRAGDIVMLQVENKLELMVGIWACLLLGAVHVVVPLPPSFTESNSVLAKLSNANDFFDKPVVIVSDHLQIDVQTVLSDNSKIHTVSALDAHPPTTEAAFHSPEPTDMALMSLTSGSTGVPKSVMHTHATVVASCRGKRAALPFKLEEVMLSWVPLDHVAGLIEYHILPLMSGYDQIHVDAQCMATPLSFLRLVSELKVTFTFAPNAFLGRIDAAVRAAEPTELEGLDIHRLHCIVSGGEAVVIKTVHSLVESCGKLGLHSDCVVPGFGMTETCAGCIFNKQCPNIDKGKTLASMGTPMPLLEIRIVNSQGEVVPENVPGELQLRGPCVFTGYYKNEKANQESFTAVGNWFRTGDEGYLMGDGSLQLTGRIKNTININGISYFSHEIEEFVERLSFVSRCVCISTRADGQDTEQLVIFFVPTRTAPRGSPITQPMSVPAMGAAVAAKCTKEFSISAAELVPLGEDQVHKGSLGKVVPQVMADNFKHGKYNEIMAEYKAACEAEKASRPMVMPANKGEETMLGIWSRVLDMPIEEISTEDNFFHLGGTSMQVLKVKKAVDSTFGVDMAIPRVYRCPTIAALAAWVQHTKDGVVEKYDPIVPMQTTGEGTPLFFVHPGVGDVLVFTDLAKSFAGERPFYGIRAPGFEKGEPVGHESMAAMAMCYADAIQRMQPCGPYILAGYSYGGVVAYEIGRLLEQRGGDVDFLAILNIPPYIRERMEQLHWKEGLLNLGWFLGIVHPGQDREECSRLLDEITTDAQWEQPEGCREKALELVVSRADATRLAELDLNAPKMGKWLDIAQQMVQCGIHYEPRGNLAVLDIFYAEPLFHTMKEWVSSLGAWEEFTRNAGGRQTGYTRVPGEHYTLMDDVHIDVFQKMFRKQLAFREWQANEVRSGRALPQAGARGPSSVGLDYLEAAKVAASV